MLINDEADGRRSVLPELVIGAILVLSIGVGIYQVQHPHVARPAAAIAQTQ